MGRAPVVAILNVLPLDAAWPTELTLSWVARSLAERGCDVRVVLTEDRPGFEAALGDADLLCVGELGPGQGELMQVAQLAGCHGRLALLTHGYPFCQLGTRICNQCPIRLVCAGSNRVAVYRRLQERADLLLFGSPRHREATETFLGAYPDKTLVAVPPALPSLDPGGAAKDGSHWVAFPNPNDPGEWQNLLDFCAGHPGIRVEAWAPRLTVDTAGFPVNLILRSGLDGRAKALALDGAAGLVQLPERPLPFGLDAAAMILAGRPVELNEHVGLHSHFGRMPDPAELETLLDASQHRLREALADLLRAGRPAPKPKESEVRPLGSTLLWAHGLGLGDSINLLPFARVLEHNAGPGGLTWVMPERHLALLDGQLACPTLAHERFDVETLQKDVDLIVEVSVYRDRCYAGDIVEQRWIQIELARWPNAYQHVHENLLSLLARAGLVARPGRPRITVDEAARRTAQDLLAAAGLDPDRHLILAVHPGAGAAIKRWPAERFGGLVAQLKTRLHAKLVLVGGPGEDGLLDQVLLRVPNAELVSRAAPLREVAALLQNCTALVGNDSGLMHLASAVDVPGLAIFGPSTEVFWGPLCPGSIVVTPSRQGERSSDLAALPVQDVLAGALRLLRRLAADPPRQAAGQLVRSPLAGSRAVRPGRMEWSSPRSAVRIAASGPGDPVGLLLQECRSPQPFDLLGRRHPPELLELLLAAELLIPAWASAPEVVEEIFAPSAPDDPEGSQR